MFLSDSLWPNRGVNSQSDRKIKAMLVIFKNFHTKMQRRGPRPPRAARLLPLAVPAEAMLGNSLNDLFVRGS